jgi:uncharacterized membrane protein
MNVREKGGLLLMVAGIAAISAGWFLSRSILLAGVALLIVGGWLFHNERVLRRLEQLERKASGSGSQRPSVPSDIDDFMEWLGQFDSFDLFADSNKRSKSGAGS